MYYSEEIIAEVQSRNDIVDVLSQFIRLQKKGSNYMCCCPFHNEKTPSFSVSQSRQMYKCFGCGQAGSVLTFLQKYENMTFPEAIKFLADRAGIKLPEEEQTAETKARESKRAGILEINKRAAGYFYYMLRNKPGEIGMEYLKKRELSSETIDKFGLGYAPGSGKGLIEYLNKAGFEDRDIINAGLAGFSEKYGMSSKFWNRVMFPIMDGSGKVIGFGGRVMGDGEPKYLNSPETDVFDKSRNLYGLHLAKNSHAGNFILCEGYMDVIALHQAGFSQAVASLGTAFTPGQANLIRRYAKEVYLSYDSDGAGVKAALRAIGILRDHGIEPKIINMEPYKDPDEFIKNLGAEEYQKRIEEAENFFMFQIRTMKKKYDLSNPSEETKYHQEIAGVLSEFSDALERDNYTAAAARILGISKESLREEVAKTAMKKGDIKPVERPQSSIASKPKEEDRVKLSEQLLLTYLAENPEIYQKVKKYILPDDFISEEYADVAKRFLTDLEAGKANPALLVSLVEDPEEQSRISALFTTKLEEINTDEEKSKALKDIVLSVKRNSFNYYSAKSGTDIEALTKVIQGKKDLEELEKIKII